MDEHPPQSARHVSTWRSTLFSPQAITATDIFGRTVLHLAVEHRCPLTVLEMLCEKAPHAVVSRAPLPASSQRPPPKTVQ